MEINPWYLDTVLTFDLTWFQYTVYIMRCMYIVHCTTIFIIYLCTFRQKRRRTSTAGIMARLTTRTVRSVPNPPSIYIIQVARVLVSFLICSFFNLFVCSFVHLLIRLLFHYFIYAFIRLFICLFAHLCACFFVRSFTCSIVY